MNCSVSSEMLESQKTESMDFDFDIDNLTLAQIRTLILKSQQLAASFSRKPEKTENAILQTMTPKSLAKNSKFQIGEVVLVKYRSDPLWPSIVTYISEKSACSSNFKVQIVFLPESFPINVKENKKKLYVNGNKVFSFDENKENLPEIYNLDKKFEILFPAALHQANLISDKKIDPFLEKLPGYQSIDIEDILAKPTMTKVKPDCGNNKHSEVMLDGNLISERRQKNQDLLNFLKSEEAKNFGADILAGKYHQTNRYLKYLAKLKSGRRISHSRSQDIVILDEDQLNKALEILPQYYPINFDVMEKSVFSADVLLPELAKLFYIKNRNMTEEQAEKSLTCSDDYDDDLNDGIGF